MSFFSCDWVSGRTITVRYPLAFPTSASPIPVFPAVPSTTMPPGRISPLASASVMMASAARSLIEPPGLRNSALPRIVQPVSSDALRSRISGVFPMVSRMPSRMSIAERGIWATTGFSFNPLSTGADMSAHGEISAVALRLGSRNGVDAPGTEIAFPLDRMLRITVRMLPERATVVLEGRLGGPWVDELSACWHGLTETRAARSIQIDLHGVTSVDAAGKVLLRALCGAGATLVATEVMARTIEVEPAGTGKCTPWEDHGGVRRR